jgi:predicted O-linked N-acetylglucosamine transferase (SPINDLY family)
MMRTPDPRAAAAFQRGVALHRQGRLNDAKQSYESAVRWNPRHGEALHLLGLLALDAGDPDRAVQLIGKALSIHPRNAVMQVHQGMALHSVARYEAAIACYDEAIRLSPNDANAHEHRGHAQGALRQWTAALESYDKAIALGPDRSDAHNSRGTALYYLQRPEDAIASYERAIAANLHNAQAYNNLANILRENMRYGAAIASYDKAIALNPNYADAYYNRGNALREVEDFPAAIASYDKAAALNPDFRSLYAVRCYTRMQVCDWHDLDTEVTAVARRIEHGEEASNPFFVLALTGAAELQKKAAEAWAREEYPPNPAFPAISKLPRRDKMRVAYFSADFHNHATMHLMAGLFEAHDRATFELTAFSFGPASQDGMRKRVTDVCEDFVDVRNRSDRDVALLARDRQIDIAVDLKGFTRDHRAGIFACRAAPLQVSYLGYPGTMGAPYMDYLIADRTLIPDGSAHHYTENIIYLPHSYQVNDRQRAISDRAFSRDELGLPQTGFVFCCFNSNYKITPGIFDSWMRILGRVEGSVLWLLEDNPTAAGNLRREAHRRGTDAGRLVFGKSLALSEHLARHRVANLFLDTLPYAAHTTASDALWAGLPVLTWAGDAFAGKVAASLLNAIGLPELIASTREQYENMAVELATSPERLQKITDTLSANRLICPLFDTRLFTRNIEAAYCAIYERYQQDLPPHPIRLEP